MIYKIPSMSDIKNIKSNGYNVISTFSGCGGSSLGYKMAGYNVLWANEFIPAAQKCYEANHLNTFLNKDDIRSITIEQIKEEINNKGEIKWAIEYQCNSRTAIQLQLFFFIIGAVWTS